MSRAHHVIAAGGSGYVFLLNAVLSICVGLLLSWRYEQKVSALQPPGVRIVVASL